MTNRIAAELLFRLVVVLFVAECVAQLVFRRQDIVNVIAAVALALLVLRYLLPVDVDTDETAPGGEQQ